MNLEHHDGMALHCSHVADLIGVMQAENDRQPTNPCRNKNVNLDFPTEKVQSTASLSLPNNPAEIRVADHQDCRLTPVVLNGNPIWDVNLGSSCSQARVEAKRRYNKKKETRMYAIHLLIDRISFLI